MCQARACCKLKGMALNVVPLCELPFRKSCAQEFFHASSPRALIWTEYVKSCQRTARGPMYCSIARKLTRLACSLLEVQMLSMSTLFEDV